MSLITNATLLSYKSPNVPDANGGFEEGESVDYPADTFALVDEPRSAQLTSLANKVSGITGAIYFPIDVAPPPAVGGQITYRLDVIDTEATVEVLNCVVRIHEDQSHFELMVKNA